MTKASSSYNTKSIRMKMSLLIQHMYTLKSHDVSDTTAHSPSGLCFSALLGCELPAELKCLSKSSSLIFPFLSFFSRRVSLKSSFKSSLSTSDSCEHTSSALTLYIDFYSYIRTSKRSKNVDSEREKHELHTSSFFLLAFFFFFLSFLIFCLDQALFLMKFFLSGVSFAFSFCSASLFCLCFSLFLSLNRMVSVSMVSGVKFGKVFPFSSGILGKRRRAKPCARAAKSRSVQGTHHFNQVNYLVYASY